MCDDISFEKNPEVRIRHPCSVLFFRFFFIISGKPGKYLSFLKHIAKKNLNFDSGNSNLVTNSDLVTNPDLVTGFGPGVMSGPCHPASNV